MSSPNTVWFPAKRYGWGWGLPNCWQGWVVIAGYALLIAIAVIVRRQSGNDALFQGIVAAATAMLVAICWWKGERPAWRWGGE